MDAGRHHAPEVIEGETIGEGWAVGRVGPVLLQIWRDGTPIEGAQAAVAAAKELAFSDLPRIATLIVVPQGSKLPESDARAVLSGLPTELGRGVGVALAFEGSGFRAAAVRAVLSGIMLLSRHRVPHDVFPSVERAAGWLQPKLVGALDARTLASATRELRARIPAA